MTGLIDYIRWRGDLSFQASPFNAVDNLILARLSYIDFNDLPEEGDSSVLWQQGIWRQKKKWIWVSFYRRYRAAL